jgi:hypothetical protein
VTGARVDVLAVLESDAENAQEARRIMQSVTAAREARERSDKARAAIAELLEAARDIPVEYDYHGNPATPELARFVRALDAIETNTGGN